MKHWICWQPTSKEWSGDFVDCVQLGEQRHAVVVGDVAGHDEIAGDAAFALSAYTRRLVVDGVPMPDALHLASQYFSRTILTDVPAFASIFIAIVDLHERTLRYASAGHEAALLFNPDGTHEHLSPTGPVLGLPAETIFGERKLLLRDGTLLVVVTDGITEARRDEENRLVFFGTRGVVTAMRDATRDGGDPAEAIRRSALAHARGVFTDHASVFVSALKPVTQTSLAGGLEEREG